MDSLDLQLRLQALEGQLVTLVFSDGEEVEARLAAVDVEDHGDIVYSVIRVVRPGTASDYQQNAFYTSRIDAVADIRPA